MTDSVETPPSLVLPKCSVSLDGEGVLLLMPGHLSWWGPPACGVQSTSQALYCCVCVCGEMGPSCLCFLAPGTSRERGDS